VWQREERFVPGHIEVSGELVTVIGLPDRAAIDAAAKAVAARSSGRDLVVLDLRRALLVPPGPIVDLVAVLRHQTPGRPMALLCDRLSGRRLLRAWCRHLKVAIVDAIPTDVPTG
jgi:hypothetical protein